MGVRDITIKNGDESFTLKKWHKRTGFKFYSSVFDTVEINNTFYKFPREKALNSWRETVQPNFQFTLKGHRYITHRKKLKDISENVGQFEELAKILKEKLGCILWQLPPNFHRNDERLEDF